MAAPGAQFADINGHRIRYALTGDADLPLVTFANGLTQNADLWTAYAAKLAGSGYRVLAYDMLGQGQSSKPVLGIELADHADILAELLDHLDAPRTHPAGTSALRRIEQEGGRMIQAQIRPLKDGVSPLPLDERKKLIEAQQLAVRRGVPALSGMARRLIANRIIEPQELTWSG